MRKRRITALVMALVLGVAAFSGCGKKDADSKYKVYYVNEDQGEILAESFLPSEEKTSTMVDEMTDKLNKKNAEGHTLLPNGVQIRECVNDDGMLLVDFTPEYRELNPVDEVLLRASIVKDYVQIPDIYLVTITVVGEPIVDSQGKEIGAMSLDNFLENTGKEIMAYQYKELNLYFTNEEGNQLVPETRQVYYNGQHTDRKSHRGAAASRTGRERTLCHTAVRYKNRRRVGGGRDRLCESGRAVCR